MKKEKKDMMVLNYLLNFFSFILIKVATTDRMPSRKNRLYPGISGILGSGPSSQIGKLSLELADPKIL